MDKKLGAIPKNLPAQEFIEKTDRYRISRNITAEIEHRVSEGGDYFMAFICGKSRFRSGKLEKAQQFLQNRLHLDKPLEHFRVDDITEGV